MIIGSNKNELIKREVIGNLCDLIHLKEICYANFQVHNFILLTRKGLHGLVLKKTHPFSHTQLISWAM